MKCPKCIVGRTLYPPKDGGKAYIGDCDRCHGTGEIEMTNEEYIRQASTEELAREIANHIFVSCTTNKAYSNPLYAMVLHDVVEWLKEIHDESV